MARISSCPQHLVVPGLLHVEESFLQRKDRLELTVAALLSRPARALALDEVEFATIRLPFAAVCQLARQTTAIERTLTVASGREPCAQPHAPAPHQSLY